MAVDSDEEEYEVTEDEEDEEEDDDEEEGGEKSEDSESADDPEAESEAEEEQAEEDTSEEADAPAYTKAQLRPSMTKRHRKLKALLLSKYESVRKTTELLGWHAFIPEDCVSGSGLSRSVFNVCWCDAAVTTQRVKKLGRMQKINHFPGMLDLVRKAGTAANLNKMVAALGKPYNFFPKTFMLPADYTMLKAEFEDAEGHIKSHGNKTWIVKPSKGCQGNGIRLTRCLDEISPHEPNIVQRYLHRPHLLNGYKYDLRLYVLLSSLQPLRMFLFREGLVRVCTQKYVQPERNMGDTRMHLTNYSVNKESADFVQPEDEHDCADASKRTVTSLMETLAEEGHDTEELWRRIGEVVVKTVISVQPHLEHTYTSCRGQADDAGSGCFELLGFDVMMDDKLRPYLLEINHTPSFRCDSPLDSAVKMAVLRGTMELVSFSRDEYKLLKRPGRISSSPEMRTRLVELRTAYELHNADRLGFDVLYPPTAATCGGDEQAAAGLQAEYDTYLEVSARLHRDMSLVGSRRVASNSASTKGPHSRFEHARTNASPGSFHAATAAAVFHQSLMAGLHAGREFLSQAKAADAANRPEPSASFRRMDSPARARRAPSPLPAPPSKSEFIGLSSRRRPVSKPKGRKGTPQRGRAASPSGRGASPGKGKPSRKSKSPASGATSRARSPAMTPVRIQRSR